MHRPGADRIVLFAILALVPFGSASHTPADRRASEAQTVEAAAGIVQLLPPLPLSGSRKGQFTSPCGFSHRRSDDPIVFPGMAGASHSHDFIANTSTNASSTAGSLRSAGTTCSRSKDTAAYWVPTLLVDGKSVTPDRANAYYLSGSKVGRTIRPFPAGLKVIAGNAKATAPQSGVVSWSCGSESGISPTPDLPTCPNGSMLWLHVRFPDCWNRTDIDSFDHKIHMAYSIRGECPASHPGPVPQLLLNVAYPILGGPMVSLSSGPAYTAHADFINAWDQTELERLVRRCLNSGRRCDATD